MLTVLDPELFTAPEFAAAIGLVERFSVPALIYATLSPASVQRTIGLVQRSRVRVLFQGVEHDQEVLTCSLLALSHPSLPELCLDLLEPHLAAVPAQMREGIVALFLSGTRETTGTLARKAGIPRRSLQRWLVRAGFPSARLLLSTPAMLNAIGLLRDTTLPLRQVARACGYPSGRQLQEHIRILTGTSVVAIRMGVTDREIVSSVVRALRGASADPSASQDFACSYGLASPRDTPQYR